MPTYGRNNLVAAAVDSALAQTIADHAVVLVVDGGPNAATDTGSSAPRGCAERALTGFPGSFATSGIRISASPFLAFLDDDNTWEPHHLEVSLAAHRAGAQLTYTGLRQVRPDGSEDESIAVPFDRRTLRNHSYIDTSTIVVRRSRAVRFSRTARGGAGVYEDWNLAFRLSRRMQTELVPEVTVRYLLHPDGYMQRHL